MRWSRSTTLALAQQDCAVCFGLGLRPSENSLRSEPCYCVTREVFRVCLRRFREIAHSGSVSRATLGRNEGPRHVGSWGRKSEEFAADFVLLARRNLSGHRYEVFRLHFLLGFEWPACCARLKVDRGAFFHDVYRIAAALGRACAELEPYALFPVDEYFTSSRLEVERVGRAPSPSPRVRNKAAVLRMAHPPARPPLSFPFRFSEAQAA